jgi:hypothetical protein
VALVKRKTDEERALAAQVREQRQREEEARRRTEAIEKTRRAFYGTPAGRARQAFESGDQVFQYAIDVMSQQAIIVAMVGSRTSAKTTDPSVILNSVCAEGWDLVNGSFVFVEQGMQSRDKFMSSGQNVAIKGTTAGYYLFKRCEANRRETGNPWEAEFTLDEDEELVCTECGAPTTPEATACDNCGTVFDVEDVDTQLAQD